MSASKIARVRRDHPEVSLQILYALPQLICEPAAMFPSIRRDGSTVIVLVVRDSAGDPVIAVVQPDPVVGRNVVLSVYGKEGGDGWIKAQLNYAQNEGLVVFEKVDFTATVPKPGSVSEDTIPSSSGLIPVDGAAKPKREILHLSKKSTQS